MPEEIGIPRQTVSEKTALLLDQFRGNQSGKSSFSGDFDPPLYNVWKQQTWPIAAGSRLGSAGEPLF